MNRIIKEVRYYVVTKPSMEIVERFRYSASARNFILWANKDFPKRNLEKIEVEEYKEWKKKK